MPVKKSAAPKAKMDIKPPPKQLSEEEMEAIEAKAAMAELDRFDKRMTDSP